MMAHTDELVKPLSGYDTGALWLAVAGNFVMGPLSLVGSSESAFYTLVVWS